MPADDPAPLFRAVLSALAAGDAAAGRLLPALEAHAGYAPGWLALGEALRAAGQKPAALMALRRAALGDGPAALLHRAGQGLAALGDAAAAEAAFRRALTADPALAAAWYSLGLVLQDRRAFAEAADAFAEARQRKPDFHEAAFNEGIARQEAGEMEAALGAYRAAYRLRPESFGRIAQALVSAPQGALWLKPSALRAALA